MYLTIEDKLYLTVTVVLSLSGLTFNLLLLYLIIWQSPPHLTPYRIFLGNTAVTQLLHATIYLIVAPRIISHDIYLVVIYLGPIQYAGGWWSYMMFVTFLHLAVNSFISIMLSMVFRWLCLTTLRFPTEAAFLMCIIGYILPLSMVLSGLSIRTFADREINNRFLNYSISDLNKYRTVDGTELMQAPVLFIVSCVSVLLIPIYFVMYYTRRKIYKLIDARRSLSHHYTTNGQIRMLVEALTVQSVVPLFTLMPASAIYVLSQAGIISAYFSGYCISPCLSLSTCVDPLVTIHYVMPYRMYVRRMLGIGDPKTSSSTTDHL
ncbi:hypothetical protein Q1695_002665 [Nippostrongylus brasiliensis]|nr:hypothetical protein Q1695_002665 [Nippostrongylus brasiliensis]